MKVVKIKIELDDSDAIKTLGNFRKQVQGLEKTGLRAGQSFGRNFTNELQKSTRTVSNDFAKLGKLSGERFSTGLTTGVDKSVKDLTGKLKEISSETDKAVKNSAKSLKSLSGQFKDLGSSIEQSITGSSKITSTLGGVGSSFTGLSSAAVAAGVAITASLGGVAIALGSLERGSRVTNLTTSFETLQNSVGRTEDALGQLKRATSGLVDDMSLIQSANTAVTLGVDDGSRAYLEATASALKLGRALGLDAKQAIDSFNIGVGRQSRLVLDNLGIIVDAQSAYQAFASEIGKTVKQLTESEKKLAFNKAAFEGVINAASGLPDVVINGGEALKKLQNTISSVSDKFARFINENKDLSLELQELARIISTIDLQTLADLVTRTAVAFLKITNAVIGFSTALLGDLSSAISETIQSIDFLRLGLDGLFGTKGFGAFSSAAAQTQVVATAADEAKKSFAGLREEIKETSNLEGLKEIRDRIQELKAGISSSSGNSNDNVAIANAANIRELSSIYGELTSKIVRASQSTQELGDTSDSELKRAARAAKKAEEDFSKLIGTLSTGEANQFSSEVDKIAQSAFFSAGGTKQLAEKVVELRAALGVTSAELPQLNDALKGGQKVIQELEKDYAKLSDTLANKLGLDTFSTEVGDALDVSAELFEKQKQGVITNKQLADSLVELSKQYGFTGKDLDDFREGNTKTIEEIIKAQKQLKEELARSGELLSQTLVGAALDGIGAATKTDLKGKFIDFFAKTLDLGSDGAKIGLGIAGGLSKGISVALEGGDVKRAVQEGGAELGNLLGGGTGLGQGIADIFEIGQSARDTAQGVGALVGAGLAAYFSSGNPYATAAGADAGALFGDGFATVFGLAAKNAYTDARDNFLGFFNEITDTLETDESGFEFLGFDGRVNAEDFGFDPIILDLERIKELVNDPDLKNFDISQFTSTNEAGQTTINPISGALLQGASEGVIRIDLLPQFTGIGTALANFIPEVDEELGGLVEQFGQILALNFQNPAGLNELQILLNASEISAQQLKEALLDAYRVGDVSAKEFLNSVSSVDSLLEDGIPFAVGAVTTAFENFQKFGASSGLRAEDALKDIGYEAEELGLSFGDLRGYLSETFDPTEVNKLFDVLESRGINTIKALQDIDLEGTAFIVSGVEDAGFQFQEVAKDVDEAITRIEEFKAKAEQEVVTDYTVRVRVTGDEVPEGFVAAGGVDPNAAFNNSSPDII